jgi:AraC family transcriptional regulator
MACDVVKEGVFLSHASGFSIGSIQGRGAGLSEDDGQMREPGFSGVRVRRLIDRSHAQVPAHAHDWPVVSLFVMGSYRNESELGERCVSGPSLVFYRAGAVHRNAVSEVGFEQLEIEFDPAWLGREGLPVAPVVHVIGARGRAAGAALARACRDEGGEDELREALRGVFRQIRSPAEPAPPEWVETVQRCLSGDISLRVSELARAVGRHPSWLGCAYRRATGEGPLETAARLRVERAACLLRETEQAYVTVALAAGFCDQSHMNRTFRRLLGRSPSQVRQDRRHFRTAGA